MFDIISLTNLFFMQYCSCSQFAYNTIAKHIGWSKRKKKQKEIHGYYQSIEIEWWFWQLGYIKLTLNSHLIGHNNQINSFAQNEYWQTVYMYLLAVIRSAIINSIASQKIHRYVIVLTGNINSKYRTLKKWEIYLL